MGDIGTGLGSSLPERVAKRFLHDPIFHARVEQAMSLLRAEGISVAYEYATLVIDALDRATVVDGVVCGANGPKCPVEKGDVAR